jgi:MoaA/NifB/PqqE/SkfB family radical SAM enzyme
MKIDKLMMKDMGANITRGLTLINMLNFDPKSKIGPIRVEIAPSSACNYRCCFCHSHSFLRPNSTQPDIMSDETIHNLITDLKKLKVKELLFSGNGEPLLCKGLIKEIKQSGNDFKIEILTNGSSLELVDKEVFRNLSYLTISLNSGTGKSHQLTHGYQGENRFPGIIGNLERILSYDRASEKVKLNYVITTDNINELEDFYKLAMKWNVIFMARPVAVDFPELKPKELTAKMLPDISEQARNYLGANKLTPKISLSFQLVSRACDMALHKISHNSCNISEHLYPCYMNFIQPYIAANGDVLLCSEGAEKPLGNINHDSYTSIWQNKENLATRIACTQMHQTHIPVFKSCVDCANVQMHSVTFHNIYSKIPYLPGRLSVKR